MTETSTVPAALSRTMSFECVEIYVPKKLENLSKLYNYLQEKLTERQRGNEQDVVIDGFSMYEVDGAFYGHDIYQERTIVLRILFNRAEADTDQSIGEKIRVLGAEVAASVAIAEEELWICHYPQGVVIFRPRNQNRA